MHEQARAAGRKLSTADRDSGQDRGLDQRWNRERGGGGKGGQSLRALVPSSLPLLTGLVTQCARGGTLAAGGTRFDSGLGDLRGRVYSTMHFLAFFCPSGSLYLFAHLFFLLSVLA